MTNNTTNPFTDPIYALEDVEYDIRMLTELINDQIELAQFDGGVINKPRANYLICQLSQQTHKLEKLRNKLFEAWRATSPLIETSQGAKRAA